MGDHPAEVKSGSSTTRHPQHENTGTGPIIEQTHESEEYQQDLKVVLGTAFGVIAVVGLIALTLLLYRVYKSRQAALTNSHHEIFDTFDRDATVEIDGKSQPLVLLLYSYDCSVHQQVVLALAGFLMEACGVTVSVDLLEEQEITDKGIDDWLIDRLQDADYIMVLCSLGARLRCSKKGVRFKPDSHQLLPDYFAVAVDYVAEKMRAEKQKGLPMAKFLTAYMDYSTRSDIPPQLEEASQFCLMKDIHKLHIHFNAQGPDPAKVDSVSQSSTCENHYHEAETGSLLKATIEQTKIYYKQNPTWMDDRLEQERAPGFSLRGAKRKHRRNSMEQPLLTLIETPQLLHHANKSLNNLGSGESYPINSEHELQHDVKLINDMEINVKISHTLPRTHAASLRNENDQSGQYSSVILQNRQNSLPSSLASSCLGQPCARHTLSKSMDSFAVDNSLHPDGLPCLFCNCTHMEARAECKMMEQYRHPNRRLASSGLLKEQGQSTSNINLADLGPSRSQTTILHAEVHHEWGHSNKGTPEMKSSTFAGDPRSWSPEIDFSTVTPYQSLPPHHQPPNIISAGRLTEWGPGMHRWGSRSEVTDLHSVIDSNHRQCHRTLSDSSVSTDDSCSISDGDSLERDLRSIHNISSYQEFINSSSLVPSGFLSKPFYSQSPTQSLEMTPISQPDPSKLLSTVFAGTHC